MNARYQRLAIDLGDITHLEKDPQHLMCLKPYAFNPETDRQIIDLIMGAYGTAYGWLSWASGENLAGIVLPYPAPKDETPYKDIFHCPIIFDPDSEYAALIFTQKAMDQDFPTYDPEKLAWGRAKLDEILNIETAQASFDVALDAAILGSIAAGQVTTATVSKRMEEKWSSLRFKLKDPDILFRDRVDSVRIRLFYELYAAGNSFAEISQSLAYNDQPAFNRAFKRWFDTSPKKWAEKQVKNA